MGEEEEETKIQAGDVVPNMNDKVSSVKSYKSVNLQVPHKALHKIKESMDHEAKLADMERDFFLLTCIAVKANLFEEYPDKPEVMNEDIMKLFVMAQKEGLEMRKFNLWIELQLRHKYDMPNLKGYKKFTKRYAIQEHLKDGVDVVKKKVKHFQKLAKYGHNYEVPEMIRKYAKHKNKDVVKANDYLNRIGTWSDNLLKEFELKNEEYFDGYYGDSDNAETHFFKTLFMAICKHLYCMRLIGATFGEFAADIEGMFDNGMQCSKMRVDDFVENKVWEELYGDDKLLFVVDVLKGKLLTMNPLLLSFCNKSIGFMRACYKGDYAAFSGNLSHYICQYMVEEEVIDFEYHDETMDKDEIINDI